MIDIYIFDIYVFLFVSLIIFRYIFYFLIKIYSKYSPNVLFSKEIINTNFAELLYLKKRKHESFSERNIYLIISLSRIYKLNSLWKDIKDDINSLVHNAANIKLRIDYIS